jgi:hypothetical protein
MAGTGWISPAVAASGTPGSTVTYTATVTIPVPPASNYAGAGGGDGWGIALSPTSVYNVFHHNYSLQLSCHLQVSAAQCWPNDPRTITTTGGVGFTTPSQPAMWLDQATGHLFVFATEDNANTAGVVCIDTTKAATVADPFCGFTALSNAGDSPPDPGYSAVSDPVVVGGKWFAFNFATATTRQLLCFNLVTLSACASQPFAVNIGGGVPASTSPEGSINAFGDQIVIPVDNGGFNSKVACFNASTSGSCAGSWPLTLGFSWPGVHGAAVPLLSSSGTITGFCIANGSDPCYTLKATPVATPAHMTSVIGPLANGGTDGWNGPALILGPRIYVPDGNVGEGQVECFDFSKNASCPDFPKTFADLGYLYSVNPDPQRPTCIWVNADDGSEQIQNFDAYTGGPCGQGAIRVLASRVVVNEPTCVPGSWSSLQVVSPVRSSYTSGTVQFEDSDANPLPGVPQNVALSSTGSLNLTGLKLNQGSGLPQFVLSLTGEKGAPGSVVIKLTWQGAYSTSCLQAGTTSTKPASPPPVLGNGMMLLGADGGMFAYGNRPFIAAANFGGYPGPLTTPLGEVIDSSFVGVSGTPGRTGYWAVDATGQVFAIGSAPILGDLSNSHLSAPVVGIAATPDGKGYWVACADGGVFTFGDAKFYGSLGNVPLAAPIVGIAATSTGKGYYLVGKDGGVFTFGDARFYGSEAATHLAAPIVGLVLDRDGRGYYLAGADGGVFSLGDAAFYGSTAGVHLAAPVVAIGLTADGRGYWLVGGDGGIFTHGDAPFLLTDFHGVSGPLTTIVKALRAPLVSAAS